MAEHVNDPYVQRAKQAGYRSRAAYKLLEIDQRDHLLAAGMTVVDLGAAPGGWSQVALQKVGRHGRVIALDLLEMPPIPGVAFLRADFREEPALRQLQDALAGRAIDLVISDMAPNISGIDISDQARSIHLAELALAFAAEHLTPSGGFLVKVFQGRGYEAFLGEMRRSFARVVSRKPRASRGRSSETYVLGRGRRAVSGFD